METMKSRSILPRTLIGSLLVMAVLFFASVIPNTMSPNDPYFLDIRVARVFAAFFTGFILSQTGLVLQILFQNRLADPSMMGISAGSALGALSIPTLAYYFFGISIGAFFGSEIGSFLFLFALILIGRKVKWSSDRFLISSVLLGLFCSSFVALITTLLDPLGAQAALVWLLGDLSRAPIISVIGLGSAGLFSLFLFLAFHREMDIFSIGDDHITFTLGVKRERFFRILLTATCLTLIASQVAVVGIVGFVGLAIPAVTRNAFYVRGADRFRFQLISSSLLGGSAVVVADLLSRILFPTREIPIGAVTAITLFPFVFFAFSKIRSHSKMDETEPFPQSEYSVKPAETSFTYEQEPKSIEIQTENLKIGSLNLQIPFARIQANIHSANDLETPKLNWLQGPNGAGKSSFLKHICLSYGGLYLSTRLASIQNLSTESYLEIHADYFPSYFQFKSDEQSRLRKLLKMDSLLTKPIEVLSSGEKSRVLLFRALTEDHPFIALDETLSHLDTEMFTTSLDLLRNLSKVRPVFLVEHDKNRIQDLHADVWLVMRKANESNILIPRITH